MGKTKKVLHKKINEWGDIVKDPSIMEAKKKEIN